MELLRSLFKQLIGRTKTCEARLNDQITQIEGLIAKQDELEARLKSVVAPTPVDLSAISAAIQKLQEQPAGLTTAQSLLLNQSLAVKDDFVALKKEFSEFKDGLDSLKDLLNPEPAEADLEVPQVKQ
jgi:phage shock protein A